MALLHAASGELGAGRVDDADGGQRRRGLRACRYRDALAAVVIGENFPHLELAGARALRASRRRAPQDVCEKGGPYAPNLGLRDM
jgi:hypothetical protein